MTFPFKNIPAGGAIRVPGFYAELDNSRANTETNVQRALLIGQITGSGTAAPNIPAISQSVNDAKTQGGAGSVLALMTMAYRANDSFGEVWYGPVADAGGGTAATGSIAFTGPSSAAGTCSLYIAGYLLAVGVTNGMSATALGAAVAAAVAAAPDLPVTAIATTGTVAFTAKNKGLTGNDIDIRLNYRATAGGEVLPAGLGATITAMAGGATNPTLTTLLGNLTDKTFDFIAMAFTDATSIAALTAFLNDATGRWSWQTQIYGHCFIAYRGTFGALGTFGVTLNDQHQSCMGLYDSPLPAWMWAAAVAAGDAVSARADPGMPVTKIAVNPPTGWVIAPPSASRFTPSQRNTLLFDGISTFNVVGGVVYIERLITTYQLNPSGQADNSYLKITTMFLLMFVLRDLASLVNTVFGRCKLAADGTRFAPGSNIVTPKIIRQSIIARYAELEFQGYVQNTAAFAAGLIVELDPSTPGRVNILWDGIFIDELDVVALLAQFRNF